MAALIAPALPSAHWSNLEPVIQGRRHVPGIEIPLYGDDLWDLACIMPSARSKARLRFLDIADPILRTTAKELLAQKLSRPLPSPRTGKPPEVIAGDTALREFYALRVIAGFLLARGKTRLVDIDGDDADALVASMKERGSTPLHIVRTISVLDHLYAARAVLTYDRVGTLFWPGRSLNSVAGYKSSTENKTPRVPEGIMAATLFWALLYVETFSPDILKAHRLVRDPGSREQRPGAAFVTPDGASTSWRGPLRHKEARKEATMLVAACYIVCAYLSGMRDGELQELRRGCLETELDAQGEVVRHRIRGLAFKGSGESLSVERKWVVIAEVAEAVGCLERLTAYMASKVEDRLFVLVAVESQLSNRSLKGNIIKHLRDFCAHINDEIAPRLASPSFPPIPLHEGKPWPFITKHFRRTLAWHIANQPFGTVAGMIQYGHTAEIIFEGYAGDSKSGFAAEVEVERELARTKDTLALYEEARGGAKPAGPMAAELLEEFQRLSVDLSPLPGRIVSPEERGRLVQHLAKRLHPGIIADCFFSAPTARCRRGGGASAQVGAPDAPIIAVCDPDCENACWTRRHLAVWEEHTDNVRRLARDNRAVPLERKVLLETEARDARIVTSIREANGLEPRSEDVLAMRRAARAATAQSGA